MSRDDINGQFRCIFWWLIYVISRNNIYEQLFRKSRIDLMLLLSMMISLPINVRASLIFVWISSISLFFLVYLRTIKKEVPLGPPVSYYQYQWWLGSANTNWHPYLFFIFAEFQDLYFFLYRVLWWLTWSFFRNLEGQSPYSKIALIKRSLQRDTKSSRNKKRNEENATG